jgi:DNA polymerase I-like protein with 3'-5' exonuclease and polymerase domains
MSNVETEALNNLKENGLEVGVKKDASILGQLETALVKIIDDRIHAALEKIEVLDADEIKDIVCTEVKYELETQEIPDLYTTRDIVQEELDNVEWADRFDVGGAVDDALGDDYVKRDELDSALDELSISRG